MPAKLTYFNARGVAEPIRLILKYKNVEFEDVRIEHPQWPELKPKQKWGVLPVFELDGVTYSQSYAICRFLGKKYGLNGANEREDFLCDELTDSLRDLVFEMRPLRTETDEAKKAELKKKIVTEKIPEFLARILNQLQGNDYLVGKKITWVDFVFSHYIQQFNAIFPGEGEVNLPAPIKAYVDRIYSIPQIKSWVESRPVTTL